jgi:hypothetical protein
MNTHRIVSVALASPDAARKTNDAGKVDRTVTTVAGTPPGSVSLAVPSVRKRLREDSASSSSDSLPLSNGKSVNVLSDSGSMLREAEYKERHGDVRTVDIDGSFTQYGSDRSDSLELTTPLGDVREVDTGTTTRCSHCDQDDAMWIFWLKRWLCNTCRNLDQYRTLCRSVVMRDWGLSFDELLQGQESGALEVMYTPNPKNTGVNAGRDERSAWMKLYWKTQIEQYSSTLRAESSKRRTMKS